MEDKNFGKGYFNAEGVSIPVAVGVFPETALQGRALCGLGTAEALL